MAEHADLIAAFDDCLARLQRGEPLDDCLRRHARFAEALRPMLEAGLLVQRSLYPAHEVAQAQYHAHMRVAQAAATLNRPRTAPARHWLGLAASLLIVSLSILTGLGIAAENSLPGDAIYPIKRLTESLRSVLPDVTDSKLNLRRLDEVRQLLALDREVDISFEGDIEQINGSQWLIAGIVVLVDPDTPGAVSAQPVDRVRVFGRTTPDGIVIASSIELLTLQRTPIPTTFFVANTPPAPSETPFPIMPSETQTATLTPSAALTAASTPTPTIEATVAACPPTLPEGWVVYTIQAGDTLSELAALTGTTIETIVTVNCLGERMLIVVGNPLFLPSMPPTRIPVQQVAPTQAPVIPTDVLPTQPVDSSVSGNGNGSGSDDSGNDDSEDDGNDDNSDGDSGNDEVDDDNSGSNNDNDDDNSGPGGGDDGGDDNSGHGGGDDSEDD